MLDIKWETKLKKRIFYSITGVTLISLCLFSVFFSSIMYTRLFDSEKSSIKAEFPQVKNLLVNVVDGKDYSNVVSSSRVTIISSNGEVLFDNRRDASKMENHANREEVLALQSQKRAESTRLSSTLSQQTYYYAEKLPDGTILRLSTSVDSIFSIIAQSIPFMAVIAACIILFSAFISSYLTNKIIAPLYDIDEPVYDELDQFYSRIKGQERYIEKQRSNLEQKEAELNILTSNIGDGIVLLNSANEIVAINNKAKRVFGEEEIDYNRKSVMELNHSVEFISAIERASQGDYSEVILNTHNKVYLLHISPVKNERNGVIKVKGAIIIIVDKTLKMQAEKMRREFSANVSHELKTPLTSILGYAELIKTGMAKPEDIQGFSEKIFSEANSLLALIEDILKISRLDEMDQKYDRESLNLSELIKTIVERLEMIAEKKDVQISTKLADVHLHGIKSILDETFYNIIENAIKYNVEHGEVAIEILENESDVTIFVKDTGIGIPKDSIERVFERFYRVDKSHSSTIKGTGLGLSIVKHAVQLHGGTIKLTSEPLNGTEMKITIPKK